MSSPLKIEAARPARLVSLDAYRGFVMLAMASAGFSLAKVAQNDEVISRYSGTSWDGAWRGLWEVLAYQTEHVAWTGCGFWDLIQPSFMFIVGVAVPFSYGRRLAEGQSYAKCLLHASWRAAVLVALGVFLASNWERETNFLFTNVLAQIGLGYVFVVLLTGRGFWLQALSAVAILGGYWYLFYQHPLPDASLEAAVAALGDSTERLTGLAAHWHKHTNYAAWFDREVLLNRFPRSEPFDFNKGGYMTLNFIPSIVTMLFGLMAGELLRSGRAPRVIFSRLLLAGLACFVVAMAVDQTIWPVGGSDWTLCPAVNRIWTPTWALFSSGWTLVLLAAFYGVIDIAGYRRWAFPLVVVGMNSIAMYMMSQLMKPWITDTLKRHLPVETWFRGPYGPMWQSAAVLLVLWLVCLWLYRQKVFLRI
jgi:predicted acyltransferase